jgi:choline kinase
MTTVHIKRQGLKPTVVLLTAGVGNRIKTHEPRALIRYKNTTLIDYQIKTIDNSFNGCDIIVVCGYDSHRINKRVEKYSNVRVVENELYEETGSASSLRLALNNTNNDNVIFIHGDIICNGQTIKDVDYSRSFILTDDQGMIHKREVGVVIHENKIAANLSFGLKNQPRWCQIGYLTGNELKKARRIININSDFNKKQLTFEFLNAIISSGGDFKCFQPKNMKVFELDSMKEFLEANVNI